MKRRSSNARRRRTTARLIRIALRAWERDAGWAAIHELRRRAGPEVLALVHKLAGHPAWRRRALALNIAAQLHRRDSGSASGAAEYAAGEARQLLRAGLRDLRDDVVIAAATGLGHRIDAESVGDLVRLAAHPNPAVRFGVTFALCSYPQQEAVAALFVLALDADPDVRDWATFGLGSLQEHDSPELRELLCRNLGDPERDVRAEAVIGLARRGDMRVIDYLVGNLGSECGTLDLDAAELLADPRLLPPLQRLQAESRSKPVIDVLWHGQLLNAIKACSRGLVPG